MRGKGLLIISCFIIATIIASPFELTEEYIKKYKDGMEELIKAAGEYEPKEHSFETLFKEKEVLKNPHEYDFIIVGGGTSGSILASRLSEIPEYNVLLLEAGYQESPITKIPSLHPFVAKLNQWGFKTVPQTHWCFNDPHHQCPVPTSKILGGTTSVNEMVYNRGNKRDFDTWADEENKEWCFDDVLPYFKKSEGAHLHEFDRKFHNQGGLQSVEDNDLDHGNNITKRFLHAGKELSYPIVDYNGKEQLGFSSLQLMTFNGVRQSVFSSFIEKVRRKNLVILRGNIVVEILISPHTKEAQGVKYIDPQGNVKVVKATKEVLLSAGPINNAKLLMLSGVGPKGALHDLGIVCLVDLPVGQYLKDHPTVDLDFTPHHHEEHDYEIKVKEEDDHTVNVKEESQEDLEHKKHTRSAKEDSKEQHEDLNNDLLEFLKNSHGPLTQPAIKALAQIKTPSSKSHAKLPDVQLSIRQPPPHHAHLDKVIISVSLNHPKSHGSVKLATKDQLKFPLIDMNFYSDVDEEDLRTMKEGLKMARVVAHKMGLKEVDDKLCQDNGKSEVDDNDECIIKQRTRSVGDLTGTTRMGSDLEKFVVNDQLLVHGVHKLRVVDLAVVPISISGDVRATGMMIGEKAGDLIKHAWK